MKMEKRHLAPYSELELDSILLLGFDIVAHLHLGHIATMNSQLEMLAWDCLVANMPFAAAAP